MKFNLSTEKVDSLKEHFVKFLKRQNSNEDFYALKNISFKIPKGEPFAIIGGNGSGKSTLLKLISGIYKPTEGAITVNGSIAPLIELGAGFDPDLTARENVYLNGAVLGYSRRFMEQSFKDIIDFAELWEFVDVPVKNYSSGMYARLGFAIATIVKPEILIVDEILSVGDVSFQKKCEQKMNDLLSRGMTLILVSHDIEQVKKMCSKAIWLNRGMLIEYGDVDTVCSRYMQNS
ncbi:MAG: ABC transporter ATP-binding protein [Eubacteriales bacterium]|nr:ABC transporter ATP-binding protein [Eubacteriales bacterium]